MPTTCGRTEPVDEEHEPDAAPPPACPRVAPGRNCAEPVAADTELGGDGAVDGERRPAEVVRTPVQVEDAEIRCGALVDEAREDAAAPNDN